MAPRMFSTGQDLRDCPCSSQKLFVLQPPTSDLDRARRTVDYLRIVYRVMSFGHLDTGSIGSTYNLV
jgi:hypothetical protein